MGHQIVVLALLATGWAGLAAGEVTLHRIENVREFAEATEPGAIQYACGPVDELRRRFAERGLAFDPQLVRPRKDGAECHIYYEPTLAGFRASTEDRPIIGLLASVASKAFVLRSPPFGESLSVVKRTVENLDRRVPVDVRINSHFDRSYWPEGLEYHFGERASWINTLPTPGIETHPWAQDYVKSGSAGGVLKVLVPRRLFEGREVDGEIHRPMLEGISGDPFVRSKLSWEGGDLLFVRLPKDPEKTLMLYGGAASEYWGRDLPNDEYEWVLKTEFGADAALPIRDASAHIDFVVSFLPGEPTAIVAQAIHENQAIAGALVDALAEFWGTAAPRSMGALRVALGDVFSGEASDTGTALAAIEALRRAAVRTVPAHDPDLERSMEAYVASYCPDSPTSCFDNPEANRRMLERDPGLARRSAALGVELEAYRRFPLVLLSMVEGQLPGAQRRRAGLADRVASDLASLGFKIVRSPHIYGADQGTEWPGVGYTNMLAVDRQLFVPVFNLGPAEAKLIERFGKRLGGDYEIVPVPARFSLLDNGGVHCVFGPIREP